MFNSEGTKKRDEPHTIIYFSVVLPIEGPSTPRRSHEICYGTARFKGSLTTCGGSESKVQYLLSKSKHSSIPRKNCFVSRSVCKLRNSCPSRVGSRQIYHLMQRIIKHFSAIYLFSSLSVGRWRHKDDRKIPISPDRFTLCSLMPSQYLCSNSLLDSPWERGWGLWIF